MDAASCLDNPQIYMGWVTPEEHPAIQAAVAAYRGVVTPARRRRAARAARSRREPRVDRWIFSTDGVGLPGAERRHVDRRVRSASAGSRRAPCTHPAMFGIGPGIEQNTHKIGECVDMREVVHASRVPRALPERVRGGRRASARFAVAAPRQTVHDRAADAASGTARARSSVPFLLVRSAAKRLRAISSGKSRRTTRAPWDVPSHTREAKILLERGSGGGSVRSG